MTNFHPGELPTDFVLGVTGHRPKVIFPNQNPYTLAAHEQLTDFARLCLSAIVVEADLDGGSIRGVVTGMAQGWDQAIAEACIDLDIPYMAAVPFRGQEQRWADDGQRRYHRLLQCAAGVCVVSPGGFSNRAMHVRNEYIVEKSHGMLAMYNGSGQGGTAGCLQYAKHHSRPVTNVWGDWTSRRTSRP